MMGWIRFWLTLVPLLEFLLVEMCHSLELFELGRRELGLPVGASESVNCAEHTKMASLDSRFAHCGWPCSGMQ